MIPAFQDKLQHRASASLEVLSKPFVAAGLKEIDVFSGKHLCEGGKAFERILHHLLNFFGHSSLLSDTLQNSPVIQQEKAVLGARAHICAYIMDHESIFEEAHPMLNLAIPKTVKLCDGMATTEVYKRK